MADPQGPPRDEALRRFDQRLETLAAAQKRGPARFDMEGGAGAGYRVLGELIGGVLTGLGLGWLLDRIAGTQPLGLIGGLLGGTGVAIFLIVRSATRMSGAAAARTPRPQAATLQDQDEGRP